MRTFLSVESSVTFDLAIRILVGFFSFVGLVVTIMSIVRRVRELQDHRFSWGEVEKGAQRIYDLMRRQRVRPATIVVTGRGGMVLGALLVDLFGEPRTQAFMIDREETHVNGSKLVKIRYDIADFVVPPTEPVLIVAGLAETGRTFDAYVAWLRNKGVSDIWTAALAETGGAGHVANFTVRNGLGRLPVLFPWNVVLRSHKKVPASNGGHL